MKRKEAIALILVLTLALLLSTISPSIYDANDTTTFKAYEDGALSDPVPPSNSLPPSIVQEHIASEYNSISSSDNERDSTSVADDSEGYLILNASVSNYLSVSQLNWSWEGSWDDPSTSNKGNLSFYLWNNSASEWFECAGSIDDSGGVLDEDTVSCLVNVSVNDFFDSAGNSYFLIYGEDPDDSDGFQNVIQTDYVHLETDVLSVTLTSPTNNTYSSQTAQTLECAMTGLNLKNSTLYIWNSTSDEINTNSSVISGNSNSTSNIYTFSDGEYSWNCEASTEGGTSTFSSSNNTITIDTIKPFVHILFPNNVTNSTHTGLDINFTQSDVNLASCWWTNNSGSTNNSISCPNNITSQTWPEGLNTVEVYANDSAGNENVSSITFRIDTTNPSLTINVPEDLEEFNFNESLELNISPSDLGVGIDSCWYDLDSSGTNVSISNCLNTTFDTTDGTHEINVSVNDSLNNLIMVSHQFTISLDGPAITLDSPNNNTYWANGTNFPLNYTCTDSNNIYRAEVWNNFNGTFLNTENNTGITSGQQNFSYFNLSDGNYNWNIFCEDGTSQGRFSSSNKTFTIDETSPAVVNVSVGTTPGSQTISFSHDLIETNPSSCKFSIYEGVNIDGLNENVSVDCGADSVGATVTDFSTFVLRIYSLDLAGNENFTDFEFSTVPSSTSEGGGGGASGNVTKIPVIGLEDINGTNQFNEIYREIFYARINEFCSEKENPDFLAIQDFSGDCQLTFSEIDELSKSISNEVSFEVKTSDMILFFNKFEEKKLFQGFETKETIDKYRLFTSVLGIPNPLTFNPPRLDKFFLVINDNPNITLERQFSANKNIKTCLITSGSGLKCERKTNSTFVISYFEENLTFFSKIVVGEAEITSDVTNDANLEVKKIGVAMRIYRINSVALFSSIVGGLFLIILGIFGYRKYKK